MKLIKLLVLGFVAGILAAPPATAATKTSPVEAQQFIQTLGDEAVKVLSDKAIPLSQRETNIRELLRKNLY